MTQTNIKCPKCGTNIEVETSTVTTVTATIERLNEADAKIAALRNAGVDVTNLFSIRGKDGRYEVGRLDDGRLEVVLDEDPIFNAIRNGETIPNGNLFRRWVMAQVFHMMSEKDCCTGKPIGFNKALQNKGYKYQWKMVLEELRVQNKLYGKDPENFAERNRWFNKAVIVEMVKDYIKLVKEAVAKHPIKHCKGIPYIRFNGRDIFVEDIPSKVFAPLEKSLNIIKSSKKPHTLFQATLMFIIGIKSTYMKPYLKQSKAFIDAYKGAGAYYTLKNLILFHGCTFHGQTSSMSIASLKHCLKDTGFEGYKLFAVLKQFMDYNCIDIAAKQAEWRRQ